VNPKTDEPLLGLATTAELLRELEVRFDMEATYTQGPYVSDARLARNRIRTTIASLPSPLLNYRTVDQT
jgi:hypothetical protein